MLLKIKINAQENESQGWKVEEDQLIVCQVTGYCENSYSQAWSLDPSVECFIDSWLYFSVLVLILRKRERHKFILYAEKSEVKDDINYADGIRVESVEVVEDFPNPPT